MIVNNTVISRVKASNNRVMIRERKRRENRNQTRFSFSPISNQTMNIWCRGLELVAKPEPIRRNQENDRVVELGQRTRRRL